MNRDFKGIWIPKEIWLEKGLNPTSRIFLAEIDSLDNGKGCYAKLPHFMELFALSKSRCSEILTKLSEQGYIDVVRELDDNGKERVVRRLKQGFGKSNEGSENRTEGSENRTEGSENRTPIYKDRVIHRVIQESNARAWDFLNKSNVVRMESWLMQHKSTIKEFENFVTHFNNQVDIEELSYTEKVLFARLDKLYSNWQRYDAKVVPMRSSNTELSEKHPSRSKLNYN